VYATRTRSPPRGASAPNATTAQPAPGASRCSTELAANGGGAFVNVLSVASWIGSPTLATYSASKSAAWGYTNAARVQLKRQGTQVVGVHVGFVDTDLTAGMNIDKIAPALVAESALDALEAGAPEAVVDEVSRAVEAALHDDQQLLYPGIEAEFNDTVAAAAR
jgi:short-subunit dehydrogenase